MVVFSPRPQRSGDILLNAVGVFEDDALLLRLASRSRFDADDCRLSRWLVYFASGPDWYPVGEFIAQDAAAAIERAIEVLGPGAAYQAEEIPWDAAPLSRAKL